MPDLHRMAHCGRVDQEFAMSFRMRMAVKWATADNGAACATTPKIYDRTIFSPQDHPILIDDTKTGV